MCVYRIRNIINNKIYVGSADNFKQRKVRHLSDLRRGIHHSRHLQRAWDKYEEENFIFEIIEEVGEDNILLEREQYYLDTLKPWNPEIGYNMTPTAGSNKGWKASEETRKNMSLSHMGNKPSKESIENNRQAIIALNRTGMRNPAAKIFYLVDPEGNKHTIKGGLRKFCQSHKIRYASINEVGRGIREEYLGWTTFKITS